MTAPFPTVDNLVIDQAHNRRFIVRAFRKLEHAEAARLVEMYLAQHQWLGKDEPEIRIMTLVGLMDANMKPSTLGDLDTPLIH